jgi:hypothetical protein
VAAYIVWQLLVRLLISQKNRIPWAKLRYRWPATMAISLCISIWILNGDYSRSSNLVKIAIAIPSFLCLFLNFPVQMAIAPIAWLTEGSNEGLACFFAVGWLSWYGLLFYAIGRSDDLTLLNLNPPPPAHKS